MRVLVLGGTSFVGAALVRRLLAEGDEVTVVALEEPGQKVEWLRVDRNLVPELRAALEGRRFEAVIDNIAYEAGHVASLVEVLEGRFGRYVLTSSVDVNGHHLPRMVEESRAPLEPDTVSGFSGNERYLRGKRACERWLRANSIPWTAIRPAMVIGVRDNIAAPPAEFLSHDEARNSARSLFFPARIQDGGPILLRQDDQAVFRLAWVDDAASALSLVARHPGALGRSFNVAGDEVFTSESFVKALGAAAGLVPETVKVPPHALHRAGLGDYEPAWGRGTYWSIASNQALRGLGWRPTPARTWLRRLASAEIPLEAKPWWHRRPREIALARHLLARRDEAEPLRPIVRNPAAVVRPTSHPGSATAEGTRSWSIARGLPPEHFREHGGLVRSSIGIGTYMGAADDATDALYREALEAAVRGGINVIDTAINYRHMRSERVVGEVVRAFGRESLVVSTKGGFVTHDALDPRSPHDCIVDRWVKPGLLSAHDAHRGHALTPAFIEAQLAESLRNLGLACVDLYFLHNPELALVDAGPARFWRELEATFERLESARREGRIGAYGLATWDGLRCAPERPEWLELTRVLETARRVGGETHGFHAVQLPFNALHPASLLDRTQSVDGEPCSAIEAAARLGLVVYASAAVGQGSSHEATRMPLPQVPPPLGRAAAALQLARSVPGVTTALAGMRRRVHVEEALSIADLLPDGGASARPGGAGAAGATMRASRRST